MLLYVLYLCVCVWLLFYIFLDLCQSWLLSSTGEPRVSLTTTAYCEQSSEFSLWERLGKAAMLEIESTSLSWNKLSSLHHTEHSSGTEQPEDEMNKALEVFEYVML